jgi:ATP-dependent HslUV protease ATP-binding subunit HslU
MDLTPKKIVDELNKHIVGQLDAKKAVAIALRSRILRKKISSSIKDEVMPKNILMIGPTGVGKTEIARRLAKLSNAPFIKVEATKYTEIGYVGKDVESIIRDLVEIAIKDLKEIKRRKYERQAMKEVKERILSYVITENADGETYKLASQDYDKGELDDVEIEIEVEAKEGVINAFDINMGSGVASIGMVQVGDLIGKAIGAKKRKKMPVFEAKTVLFDEIMENLTETDETIKEALSLAEEEGIVFIDEIDKIAFSSNAKGGEVSREGVQRDLLPLIEGTTVQTKYGNIKTDHILFVGSGAFYSSKPSDLSPELQGRFPVRVELKPLTKEDMVSILKTPQASLLKQYTALLKAEGIVIDFAEDGILEVAEIASKLNGEIENIGARRLHTILEKILHETMFNAPSLKGTKVLVDKTFVLENMKGIADKIDLAKFIL